MEKINQLPNHQFRFRPKHSNEQVDKIIDNTKSKRFCSVIFLRVEKTFGKVLT